MYISKRVLLIFGLFLAGGLAFWGFLLAGSDQEKETTPEPTASTEEFADEQLGVKFSLPDVYAQKPDTKAPATQKGALPAKNFERANPQGLFTIRYEAGLAAAANLQRRTLLEHIEAEIRQFFPVRYQKYQAVSTERTMLTGRESVEHVFTYEQDARPVKARVVIVPFGSDSAYYLILQAHHDNYDAVNSDLDQIKESLQLRGPTNK